MTPRWPVWTPFEPCQCPRCRALEAHTRALATGLPLLAVSRAVPLTRRRDVLFTGLAVLGEILTVALAVGLVGGLLWLVWP